MKAKPLRAIVGCEFSGVVRRALRDVGIEAYSSDLLPAEDGSPYHLIGDVRQYLHEGWDLGIFHPPCTYLANSGNKHLYLGKRKENGRDPQRWQDMERAADFFRALLDAPIDRIAVENPVMHGHGQALIGRGPTQSIQPWQFGHGEIKRTCLWLKNLPPLLPTEYAAGRVARVHREGPGPERWKNRSRTYEGIARAMADQWGRALRSLPYDRPLFESVAR